MRLLEERASLPSIKEGSVDRDVCSYRREKLDELKLCSLKFLSEIKGKIMSETEKNGRRKGDLRKVIKT